MTREEKISAIYQEMANKKRTFGCRCRINDGKDVIFIRQNKTWSYLSIRENEEFTVSLWYTPEIIWHPVMIWDVLRQIRLLAGYALDNDLIKKSDFGNVIAQHNYRITQIWEDFREPIEEQSDECIDYVYSLIPSKSME